jgi:hypothetical protein
MDEEILQSAAIRCLCSPLRVYPDYLCDVPFDDKIDAIYTMVMENARLGTLEIEMTPEVARRFLDRTINSYKTKLSEIKNK